MRGQGRRPRGRQKRLSGLFPSPAAPGTAARTPFVLLVVVLLGSGLISLLLLNSALNQGSFELSTLEKKTDELTEEQQALQQEVDAYSAPGALERRARELGMVPGGSPAFLLPDGRVLGKPGVATSQGAPLSTAVKPSASALLGLTALTSPSGPPVALSAPAGPPAAALLAPSARPPAPPASAAPDPQGPPAPSDPHHRPAPPAPTTDQGTGAAPAPLAPTAPRAPSETSAPAPPSAPAPAPTTSGR
ncbi:septum formation initiator family protein [Streptomyces sp. NPDC048506]|uniref:FtsB family cell division protein n=1 Tax=Streptomyces sp. NPDC048506 TaxID=3155028 RepID=UPI00343EFE7E